MIGPLLSARDVRALADAIGFRPTRRRGQNFVVDPNTIRRIIRVADIEPWDEVLEIGPGLGSLTLGLVESCAHVVAIEVDRRLAEQLQVTVSGRLPGSEERLEVLHADAMRVPLPLSSERGTASDPRSLVANLPYSAAVPILLRFLAGQPSLTRALVMVQIEVARRLAAPPGSEHYGAPSVKIAWYGAARFEGSVPATVFWPMPRVGSGLVSVTCMPPPLDEACRIEVFACVDAAFAQRRKMLRSSLAAWGGGTDVITRILEAARVDPSDRAEVLSVGDFVRITGARNDMRPT